MTVRVAINGFGRIGRLTFRAAWDWPEFDWVLINDPKGGAVIHGPRLFEQPTCHWRPATDSGPLAEEASSLLRSFFRQRRGTAAGRAR